MTNPVLSSYSREALNDTLRVLRNYKNSLRQVGKRAHLEDPRTHEAPTPSVEYAPGLDATLLKQYAENALKLYFSEYSGGTASINFTENPKLVAGVRIRYGDDLVDLSFQKFTHLFHN